MSSANAIGNCNSGGDLAMLAVVLAIIAAGSGRISISHLVKKIPRFLQ